MTQPMFGKSYGFFPFGHLMVSLFFCSCIPQRLVRFDSPCKCCELAAIIVDALVLRNFPVDVWARAPIEALYKKAVHYSTSQWTFPIFPRDKQMFLFCPPCFSSPTINLHGLHNCKKVVCEPCLCEVTTLPSQTCSTTATCNCSNNVFTISPTTIYPESLCPQCPDCTVTNDTIPFENFNRTKHSSNHSFANFNTSTILIMSISISANVLLLVIVLVLFLRRSSSSSSSSIEEPSVSFRRSEMGTEMVKISPVNSNTNEPLGCGSLSVSTQDHLNIPVSLPSPEMGVVHHAPIEIKANISSPVVQFLPPPVPPPEPAFSFPEVPTAGELLMLELEENRRYRQAKENLVSPPPTPITFTDL